MTQLLKITISRRQKWLLFESRFLAVEICLVILIILLFYPVIIPVRIAILFLNSFNCSLVEGFWVIKWHYFGDVLKIPIPSGLVVNNDQYFQSPQLRRFSSSFIGPNWALIG